MSTLERAIEITTEAHRGQRDKAGNDYIGHPLRVMAAGHTPEEKIVGVLHDVVEDSDWTLERLAAEGFAPEILEALRCLTHAEEEFYDRYIARMKGNPLAVAVKLNDLADNMDIRRLPYGRQAAQTLPAGLQAADRRADLLNLRLSPGVSERLSALDRSGRSGVDAPVVRRGDGGEAVRPFPAQARCHPFPHRKTRPGATLRQAQTILKKPHRNSKT